MVLLERYYDVIDRPSLEVSRSWKVCQIIFYIFAATTGFAASYLFGVLRNHFGDNCILFPHLNFLYVNNSSNDTSVTGFYKLDWSKTVWGDDDVCDLCQYIPIMSMILGTIFLTFFIMCPRGGSRESDTGIRRPWHIVPPSITLTGIFLLIILASSLKLQSGLIQFCAEFEPILNTTDCDHRVDIIVNEDTKFYLPVTDYIKTIPVILGLCVLSWIIAFTILLLRCCCFMADFKLIQISIHKVESDESAVLLEARQDNTSSPITHV